MNDGVSHLKPGVALPRIALPTTTGREISLADVPGRSVLIVYPWTGRPGHPNPPNWDGIEGAHGSTPELEGFRDLAGEFATLDVRLFGLSRQVTDWQREAAMRLRLPFPILSDAEGRMTAALALPSFATGGESYLKDSRSSSRPARSSTCSILCLTLRATQARCCDGSEKRTGPKESRPRRPRPNSRAGPILPRDSRRAAACREGTRPCG
jgi:peroxiredoxin